MVFHTPVSPPLKSFSDSADTSMVGTDGVEAVRSRVDPMSNALQGVEDGSTVLNEPVLEAGDQAVAAPAPTPAPD